MSSDLCVSVCAHTCGFGEVGNGKGLCVQVDLSLILLLLGYVNFSQSLPIPQPHREWMLGGFSDGERGA